MAASFGLACHPALAADETIADSDAIVQPEPALATAPLAERTAKPLWELGLGGVALSQLAYPGAGVRIDRALGVPYAIYRGPVFRADENNVGLRAFRSTRVELDLGVAAAFGSDNSEVRIRSGLPELGTLAEIGPQLSVRLGAVDSTVPAARHPLTLELPLRGVFNVTDDFAYRGLAFEPKLVWRTRLPARFDLSVTTSLVFGSRKLADTFYGVAERYARPGRPAYEADAGLISTRLGISLGRALGPDWRLVAFARLDHVGGASNEDSPLVESRHGWTAGIGFNWTVLRSSRPAAS